ncbi:fimbrial protein [Pseudoxanthomonas kalamensis DSM 18571]|uniref:PilN domain-containing protein n=1 Tax=Pseudoxanthomonas kalamensis TaxID=289483 RepID=UPI001390A84D|nr:PilN domain-containing protein [Pseudoxanthomonas kalamensis]KAF1711396.1 fimbrial protein [Pseudoxanthomonas kalamensis DSM 18571]
MAKINLLPWRAERRAARQKEFYGMLGFAALAGVALAILLWLYYGAQISGQEGRNQFLTSEITKLDAQIAEIETLDKQKDRLLARKKVIEELQANRSQMVHLFDSLVRTIPDGVALTNLKQEGEVLTIEGRAQSNARVSSYMRNLESSGWMTKPDLAIIEAKAPGDAKGAAAGFARALPYTFTLQVRLATPNDAEAAAADGASGDTQVVEVMPAAQEAAPANAPASTPADTESTPASAPAQPEADPATAPATETEPAS